MFDYGTIGRKISLRGRPFSLFGACSIDEMNCEFPYSIFIKAIHKILVLLLTSVELHHTKKN
jgi:hypothetical protein